MTRLSDDERHLLLAGQFELTITYLEDDHKVARCKALADRLGGDPKSMFLRSATGGATALPLRLSALRGGASALGGVLRVASSAPNRTKLHDRTRFYAIADP